MTATTSLELWDELVQSGAIQETLYDEDIAVAIRQALGGSDRAPVKALLIDKPAQVLIDILLDVIAPFSGMMTDLLALYAKIGAKSGDKENLRLHYAFDENDDDLSFDLSSFREWEEVFQQAHIKSVSYAWSQIPAWEIVRALGEASEGTPDFPRTPRSDQQEWAETGSPSPTSENVDADEVIRRIWRIRDAFLTDAKRAWPKRETYRQDFGDAELGSMTIMVSDWWDEESAYQIARFAARVAQLIEAQGPLSAATLETIIGSVRTVTERALGQMPAIDSYIEGKISVLKEILSLPTWGKRHDIYSAWIFCSIVEAIGFDRMTFHVVEGRLSFNFSGSHLASLQTTSGLLEVWAELKTHHPSPIGEGRTRGIQPDYSLTLRPVSDASTTVLAIECKQYKRSALRNPADAMCDYTSGLKNATVILATYGPVSRNVLQKLPESARSRSVVVRDMQPIAKASVLSFQNAVAKVIVPLMASPDANLGGLKATQTTRRSTEVELTWSSPETDLDLWAQVGDGPMDQVSYKAPIFLSNDGGTVSVGKDATSGPGSETLTITTTEKVTVRVHSFRGLPLMDAEALLRIRSGAEVKLILVRDLATGSDPNLSDGLVIENGRLRIP